VLTLLDGRLLLVKKTRMFTAIIEKEESAYVALCPELDVASQGNTVEEARKNLTEAVELFLETADPSEVAARLTNEIIITPFEVAVG
jgi:predicted RNase H-like HicB family nuclease